MRHLRFTFLLLSCFVACGALLVAEAQARQGGSEPSADKTRGLELFRQGSYQQAGESLRAAVEKRRDDAEAWYYLGLSFERVQKKKEASAVFDEAVTAVPDAEVWHHLGRAITRAGWEREARQAFLLALRLRPDFAAPRVAVARLHLLANELGEAKSEAARALASDAANAEAHCIVGEVRLREGALADALESADSALKADPEFRAAWVLKGLAKLNGTIRCFPDDSGKAEKSAGECAAQFNESADHLERAARAGGVDADLWRGQAEMARTYAQLLAAPAVPAFRAGPTLRPVITYREKAKYTEEARSSGVQGAVVLRAVLSHDGRVEHVQVLRPLSHSLTEQAMIAARRIKFLPVIRDGHPVSIILQVEFHFSLF
jgi:TonB family protein